MKRNGKYIFGCLALLSIISLFAASVQGYAKEQQADQEVGYTVKAMLPETQLDRQKSFFYFQVRPDEKQIVKVKVTSMQKDPITVVTTLTNAFTNSLGEIGYTGDKNLLDQSLAQPLSEIVSIQNPEVTVENFEEKYVEILVAPTEHFDGIKLGALEFSNKQEKSAKGLESNYGYRIGMMIAESAKRYEEPKQLNLLNVFPTLNHGKRAIALNFQNPEPQINKEMNFEVSITKDDDPKFEKKLNLENARMAPNSTFNLMVNWGLKQIQPGNYQTKVKVVSASGIWEWDKSFYISDDRADKVNDEAAYNLVVPKWIKYLIVALGIFWFVINCYLLYRRKLD